MQSAAVGEGGREGGKTNTSITLWGPLTEIVSDRFRSDHPSVRRKVPSLPHKDSQLRARVPPPGAAPAPMVKIG